ncbi:TIGR02680 family protein [Streptomyces sp. NPDC059578]|uniref:TIGR02680 family protein n=1 Tax=unclassified Streptomyces TaxID=2593676 RepID=UPI003655BC6B
MTTALPTPDRTRWQPLRIGLVDLFHYDVEEFHFRAGRLLLRGNNGTGKSKVLALTLPFLLDGDLSPRRVEPDGDPGKRMEWNLLLGGEHPHSERLGYTWIEFGRRDETTGEHHFRTLLCGLKAVSGRGIARHWYALTSQRVDHRGAGPGEGTLSLLDATGTALSRDRLAEAVADHGMVYDQARTYRRAVDETLFGLGPQRYAALVDLLIQLRQPQLSKRPNEKALSRALTEALPPMDQAVIADVAEAFRSLDEEKDELTAATSAERAAAAFLEHYRRYARIAARRRARLPRAEHSRYEHLQRDLADAQTRRAQAEEARAAAETRITDLEDTHTRLSAQDAALREGPEMRSAKELDRAALTVRSTAQARSRALEDRQQAVAHHTRAVGRLGAAEQRLDRAARLAEDTFRQARDTASAARTELPADDRLPVPELRRAADAARERRHRAVDHLDALAKVADEAAEDRRRDAVRLDEAAADLDHAAETQQEAEQGVETAGRALLDEVRERAHRWTELALPDLPGVLDDLQEWVRRLDGPYPVRAGAARAHTGASAELAARTARTERRRTELGDAADRVQREVAALEAGGPRAPGAPTTRTPGLRDRMPGAPLWRLVDFHDGLGQPERAGLEAALEASGLLDAWVLPDGSLLAADGHDVLLAPTTGPLPGGSLAALLRVAVDPADARAATVGEGTVTLLLSTIGAGPQSGGSTWAAVDGRFRVGALTGRWAKTAAEYIGAGAREAARRARLDVLHTELAFLRAESEAVEAELTALRARRRTLDDELADVPDEHALTRAHAAVAAAAELARRARLRHTERGTALHRTTELAEVSAAELTSTAADLGLPADPTGRAALRRALGALAEVLAALWPALRARDEVAAQVGEERGERDRAQERVDHLTARAHDAARDAAAADERHTTLRATVGAAVADLQRQLAENDAARTACVAEQRRARTEHTEADRAASRAEGHIEKLDEGLTAATEARTVAIAALQRFTGTGLIAVALPDLPVPAADAGPWAATPAVAFARAVEAGLSATDDSDAAWERVQGHLSRELKSLQDTLSRHGHSASARMVEDGMVVDIVYQGRERAVPELAGALALEVAELTRILSAREREVLETHLITEVAGTLQELIGAAERQVRDMNAELEERPTSTGMRLRLVWRASRTAPAGLAEAGRRLRQSADAWSTEDRVAVGEFLQAQIARQHTEDASGSWLEHLSAALDYRSWHEFAVERHQHGRWVTATGPASGGERVLAVSVPLFAAASSHYATAGSPYAPRLVTLDEAFAGVDDDSRAKCLGLLHAFDLDVVMTSEREWACYPQVPGIAIAQLSRIDEVAAVLVTRWEWDGHRVQPGVEPARTPITLPEQRTAQPAGSPEGPEPLWT